MEDVSECKDEDDNPSCQETYTTKENLCCGISLTTSLPLIHLFSISPFPPTCRQKKPDDGKYAHFIWIENTESVRYWLYETYRDSYCLKYSLLEGDEVRREGYVNM